VNSQTRFRRGGKGWEWASEERVKIGRVYCGMGDRGSMSSIVRKSFNLGRGMSSPFIDCRYMKGIEKKVIEMSSTNPPF
jgi:hypothetical protein